MMRSSFAYGLFIVAGLSTIPAHAYNATARTAAGSSVVQRLFVREGTPAPVNSRLWFVADTANDGVPTSPAPGAVLGSDDRLVFEDVVDGTIVGNQDGRYQRVGIAVPDAYKTASIYVYLWSAVAPTNQVPSFQPRLGDTFGLYRIGVVPPPQIGNSSWDITNNVFSVQYAVGGAQPSNRPPVLGHLASQRLTTGVPWELSPVASDPDLPSQSLSFTLTNAPAGMTIETSTGRVRWTPGSEQAGNFTPGIIVTDNGTPPQAAIAVLDIVVQSATGESPLLSFSSGMGNLTLSFTPRPGRKYRLEFTESLAPVNWRELRSWSAAEGSVSHMEPIGPGTRFFRLVENP